MPPFVSIQNDARLLFWNSATRSFNAWIREGRRKCPRASYFEALFGTFLSGPEFLGVDGDLEFLEGSQAVGFGGWRDRTFWVSATSSRFEGLDGPAFSIAVAADVFPGPVFGPQDHGPEEAGEGSGSSSEFVVLEHGPAADEGFQLPGACGEERARGSSSVSTTRAAAWWAFQQGADRSVRRGTIARGRSLSAAAAALAESRLPQRQLWLSQRKQWRLSCAQGASSTASWEPRGRGKCAELPERFS